MAKPLGFIRDQNTNLKQVDVYALILNNVVVNMILASYNDILAINNSYDYCVDMTVQGQSFAGMNSVYNPSNDTFVQPPAPTTDWVQNLEYDFDAVVGGLQQAALDAGNQGGSLTAQQIQAGYNSALNDNLSLTSKQIALLQSIYQYILNGGG